MHDLRRTFSTKMAEWQLAQPPLIERMLNHTVGSMTPIARVYNRWSYLTEMRDVLAEYPNPSPPGLADSHIFYGLSEGPAMADVHRGLTHKRCVHMLASGEGKPRAAAAPCTTHPSGK